jgi:MFS family permease
LGLILAPTWQLVLAGEGLSAITRSLVAPSFGAFIAEESSEENRARVYGITQTIFTVVTVIGPPFGGFLVDKFVFKFMLLVAGIIYSIATVIRVMMARRAASHARSKTNGSLKFNSLKANLSAMTGILLAGGLITWALITDGVRDVSFSLSGSLLPIYMQDFGDLSAQQIGWLMSIFGVANMLVNIPAGWLADKKSDRLAIILGFVVQAGALFLLLNVSSFWGYAIVWAVFGIGVGLMGPAYQSLISKVLPQKLRGTGFGLIQSSLGVFSLPAPAIGASLYQNVSPKLPFTITAWASLLAIIPVWLKFKITQKDEVANAKALSKLEPSAIEQQSEPVSLE